MSRNSALEDLRATTLKAFAGTLKKLEYLVGLRDAEGTYSHWGLAKVHGELAATRALEQEHRQLVSKILATPLPRLVAEVQKASHLAGETPAAFVERLRRLQGLLPPEPGGGCEQHLNSVMEALSSLTKSQPRANPPAS
jgi:hypothetical protein